MSYCVEKIVLHHVIFYLQRLVSVYWQFYHNCKYKAFIGQKLACGIKFRLEPINTY